MKKPLSSERACYGRNAAGTRRAVAALVVLLLVTTALAVSYAVMRSQGTAAQIHANANRQTSARQAALTGLAMALKHMQTSAWTGVNSTLSRTLGTYESFTATYTAGDPSLGISSPDYSEYPYRVTILSTGFAQTPGEATRVAKYRVRAVVRLLPKKLSSHPADWDTMQNYTVYQTYQNDVSIDIPCRFEGSVRFQRKLHVAAHYPNYSYAWTRYLTDLNRMRQNGYPDYRPLNGPVRLPYSVQDADDITAIVALLGLSAQWSDGRNVGSDWVKPQSLTKYQLYTGGPTYTIPTVGDVLQNVTLGPDPLSNPLGVYYRDGTVELKGNVTIRGSLVCKDDIKITGTNVSFQTVDLPPIYNTTAPIRMPEASCKGFLVTPTAGGSLAGLLAVFEEFRVEKSPDTVAFALTGRLITSKLNILERQPWDTADWKSYYVAFIGKIPIPIPLPIEASSRPAMPKRHSPFILTNWSTMLASGSSTYFPLWMGDRGYNPQPRLTVKPDPSSVTYHWHNWYDPVYVPPSSSEGLRWELISWTENP